MKERFGRPKGPSKEDIEREAERELARLTRNAPGPSTGGGFGGPDGGMGTPLDEIASSVRRGRPSAPEPNLGVLGSIGGGPGGYKGGAGEFNRGLGGYGGPSARRGGGAAEGPAPGLPADFEDPEEERATITELALRDLAARDGTNPDDLVIRQDPGMAEAMRDEAMRRFFDRQQTRQPVASTPPIDPADTVLGRLAARRKAEEEGRTLDEDDDAPSGGGLLDRLRQRQEAEAAQAKRPSGRRAASGEPLRDRRGGKGAYEVDDDDDDGPAGLRARVTARRRDEINAENRPGRVFAMPFVDDAAQQPGPDPELAAVASRLYEARAKTARRRSGRAGGAKKAKKKAPAASAPTRARKAKPAAKTAAKRAGGTRPAPKATKVAGGARAASSRRAAAGKAAAGKAAARKSASPAKRATRAPAKATRAPAKATRAPAKATRAPAKATRAPAKRATKATKAAGTRASRRR